MTITITHATDTPVLLLVFNRPTETAQLIEKLRVVKPTKIYIAADGPRENNSVDLTKTAQVRDLLKTIDWDCQIDTLYRRHNLGCRLAVSEAITWFFEKEDHGIILEDDCIPSTSFFDFSCKMLNQYKNDTRMWMISGFNPITTDTNNDYFYSKNPSVWGWATWRDRWNHYDVHLKSWPDHDFIADFTYEVPGYVIDYYRDSFDRTADGTIDTWDYQWTYVILKNNGLVIKPRCNMVSNIGAAGHHAVVTNAKIDANLFLPTFDLDISSGHGYKGPENIMPNQRIDYKFYQTRLKKLSILKRCKSFFIRLIK